MSSRARMRGGAKIAACAGNREDGLPGLFAQAAVGDAERGLLSHDRRPAKGEGLRARDRNLSGVGRDWRLPV